MSHLELFLLGKPDIRLEGRLLSFHTRKALALLAYLSVTGRGHNRDSLAALFWPELDQTHARSSLRHALWALGNAGMSACLEVEQESVGLKPGYGLDVTAFQEKISRSLAHPHSEGTTCHDCLGWLTQAADLYRGDFLAGFSLRDSPEFDDWQCFQAESLRQRLADVLERLVCLTSSAQRWEPAIEYARQWVGVNPLHEPAQRALMRVYALGGKRGLALKQYEHLRLILDRELGVEPEPESKKLYKDIQAGRLSAAAPVSFPTHVAPVEIRQLHNLPTQLTSFIGRKPEIGEIKARLRLTTSTFQMTRLLTLIGPGGSGKTRLALQTAEELAESFPGGVWLVELAGLSEPVQVPHAAAAALEVQEQPGREVVEGIAHTLRYRPPLLIILDNCEHLADSCASLARQLLGTCPDLRILATSRSPLGLRGETIWPVMGLSLPPLKNTLEFKSLPVAGLLKPSQPESLEFESVLGQSDAVRLFIERAATAYPGFTLTGQNAASVMQICSRLDGIPLAIELAAARVKLLSTQQIAGRLDNAFRLLTRSTRAALPRHQTLRAAVDWSYELLSNKERVLFRRLALFAGGFTLAAVESVCSGEGLEKEEILDLLSGLVDQSLVSLLERDWQGEARYRLLEIIRQYSLEKLEGSGEVDLVRENFLDFFIGVAEEADRMMRGPSKGSCLRRLEADYDNLREALKWTVEVQGASRRRPAPGDDPGLRLAASLWHFWEIKGYFTEGRGWLEKALSNNPGTPSPARAKALSGIGTIIWHQADMPRAITYHEESLATYRQIGDPLGTAFALNNLACQYNDQGHYDRARAFYEESLALYRSRQDAWGIGLVLINMGATTRNRGDPLRAARLYKEALPYARKSADPHLLGMLLFNMGELAQDQGDEEMTVARFEEAILQFNELGEKSSTYDWMLRMKGDIALAKGEVQHSIHLLHERLRLCREIGDKNMINESLEHLARGLLTKGSLQAAAHLLGAAEFLRKAIDIPLPLAVIPAYNSLVAALSAGLGEEAFQEAITTGKALADEGLERVVAYALEAD